MVESDASIQSAQSASSAQKAQNAAKASVALEDYNIGVCLGQGAYGKVMLANDKQTGRSVAIKEVNKKQILSLGKSRHIFREKDLLNEMDHPFIIKLLGTAQDENSLYFIFENCAKGDLAGLVQERRKLDIRLVRSYTA